MTESALNTGSRLRALDAMSATGELDVLVLGGGATGAGIAVDAVTRGLATGIVEAQDWAQGTSSRSSQLIHGGLRYLARLDFGLVHESLTERDRLLTSLAPHLVQPVPFCYPLTHRVWERPYIGLGLALYDALAHASGRRRALPAHRHLSRSDLMGEFAGIKPDIAVGAVRYFDAKVDDARLVVTLVRTAAHHGAMAASRAQVTGLIKDASGIVRGAEVADLITGQSHRIAAKHVIAAGGVWTETLEKLAGTDRGLRVLASKGVHLVVPRDRIEGRTGLIWPTEKSVLLIIPRGDHWIIGTTDTPWLQDPRHPVASHQDIDYLLDHANRVLRRPLRRSDVTAVYAGLRPLLRPGTGLDVDSAKISREHSVASPAPGLTVIAGGKLTTYRVMARDAVDFALGPGGARAASVTDVTPLLGAEHFAATLAQRGALARRYGWSGARVKHLMGRYGSLIRELTSLIDATPALNAPVAGAENYLAAEVVYAATHEGALTLDDVMTISTVLGREVADAGLAAAGTIADLVAPHLGWGTTRRTAELAAYADRIRAERAAWQAEDDAAAAEARATAADPIPMREIA